MRCSRCGENTLTPAGPHSAEEADCDCWIEYEVCEGCNREYPERVLRSHLCVDAEERYYCEGCMDEDDMMRQERADNTPDGCCIYCSSSKRVQDGISGYPSCLDCRRVQLLYVPDLSR
jgi:hypothetical protein